MVSLKQACHCLGLSGQVSLVRNFFGFWDRVPTDVSVLTQVRRVQGRHVHVNLITVGNFTTADRREVSSALQDMRDTYAQVNLGVGRAQWYYITASQANGRDHIDSDGEAEALTDEWTVDNHAMDIFFVLTYSGSTIGLSRVDGPCDKDAKGMDGSVVAIEGSTSITGLVLAHEAAHYLGLHHVNNSTNLMNPSVPNGGGLTSGQGNTMRDHCFVNSGC
ncbi:matrixin family metalloprotease [Thermodesulfobacteriota bacterium B35]